MKKNMVTRVLEALFAHKVLALLPLGVFVALGAVTVGGQRSNFQSTGVLAVSLSSVVSDITDVRTDSGFTWETPAAVTSRQIADLIGTEAFASDIASRAGLTSALESNVVTLDSIRDSLAVFPGGDTLVRVRATTDVPELSQRLAQATIDSFLQFQLDSRTKTSGETVEFLDAQIDDARAAADAASEELDQYLFAHPQRSGEEQRPDVERVQIQQLENELDAAMGVLDDYQRKRDEAELLARQAESDVSQRYSVVDDPNLPFTAQPRLKAAIMTMTLFTLVGALLSLAGVVAAALLDRSVRYPDEVRKRLGTDVLAVVPAA
jgi:uncharacterized protein involved in exopolysaccharide biosynthesis